MVAVHHSHVFHHLQRNRVPPPWFYNDNADEGALPHEGSPFSISCAENYTSIENVAGPLPSARVPPTSAEVSGYLCGIASDNCKGRDLQNVLQDRDIVIDLPPPLQPVTDTARYASHGVVKINNIPFTVSAQEIVQFVNRFSPVPMLKKSPEGYPIHIIMEKPTGKTMDCFIEFPTHAAARECVRRFDDTAHPGRGSRLGTRNVNCELSDQAELMHALFPRARLVEFDSLNGAPTILSRSHDPSWSAGFRGYFTLEEVYGVTRFAECPSRSPFVLKCHQRTYECMISTLYKFPWAATKTYTVAARNALLESAWRQLTILSKKVGCPTGPAAETSMVLYNYNGKNYFTSRNPLTCDPAEVRLENREVGLSQSLLFDLLSAAVSVPAFNLLQKLALCQAAGSYGRAISLHPFSHTWPFQTLEPVNGTPDHVIKFWLELFDTGFDIMESENSRTTFEHYLVFTRNKIGFPIAEWTNAGIELPFEDATRVETAAMMCYVSRGRDAWAAGQQTDVQSWQPESLMDLMDAAALEIYSNKSCKQEVLNRGAWSETPSPRASTNGGYSRNEFHLPKWLSDLGLTRKPRPKDERLKEGRQFDAVTGKDLAPSSISAIETDSGTNSSGEAAIVDRLARPFTNCIDLGQSPSGVKTLPRPQVLNLDTNDVNLSTTFKDPFAAQVDNGVLLGRQTSSDASLSPFEGTIPQRPSDTTSSPSNQLTASATSSRNGHPISTLAAEPHDIVLTGVARQIPLRAPSHTQQRQANSDGVAQRLGSSFIQDNNAFSSGPLIQGSTAIEHDDDPFISAKINLRPMQTYPTMHNATVGNFGPIGSGVRASSIQLPSSTYAGDAECSHVYNERLRAQSIQIPVTNTPNAKSWNCVRTPRISATDLWDNINASRRRS